LQKLETMINDIVSQVRLAGRRRLCWSGLGHNAQPVGAKLARDGDLKDAIAGKPCSYNEFVPH
jgi:hypothetical protein